MYATFFTDFKLIAEKLTFNDGVIYADTQEGLNQTIIWIKSGQISKPIMTIRSSPYIYHLSREVINNNVWLRERPEFTSWETPEIFIRRRGGEKFSCQWPQAQKRCPIKISGPPGPKFWTLLKYLCIYESLEMWHNTRRGSRVINHGNMEEFSELSTTKTTSAIWVSQCPRTVPENEDKYMIFSLYENICKAILKTLN